MSLAAGGVSRRGIAAANMRRLATCLPTRRPLIYSCMALATNRDVEDNRKWVLSACGCV